MVCEKVVRYAVALVFALGVSAAGANEGGGHGGGGGSGSPDSIALEPLIVNLQGGHYIQIKPLLKLKAVEDAEAVRSFMPVVRHALIKFMIGRDATEAASPKFMGEFSELATDALNKALDGKYIKDVIFDSWLVQ